jgi:tetratricopeptide (TPR) repeat protein
MTGDTSASAPLSAATNRRLSFAATAFIAGIALVGALAYAQGDLAFRQCLGLGYWTDQQSLAACTALIKSGNQAPDDRARIFAARARLNVSASFLEPGKADAAIADFDEAIRLVPPDSALLSDRAFAFEQKEDWARALRDYDESISLDPTPQALAARARVHKARSENELAIADLDASLRLKPDAFVLLNRANTHADTGDYTRAAEDAQEAFRIGLSDPFFARMMPYRVPMPGFRLSPRKQEIEFYGEFTPGAAREFERLLGENPGITRVRLTSPGGAVDEGDRFARAVRKRNLDTYVAESCSSACTIVFLAGRERMISPTGRLGFHQTRDHKGRTSQHMRAVLIGKLRRRAVSEAFARHVAETAPEDMWYPASSELIAEQIVTRIRDTEFADRATDTQKSLERKPADVFVNRGERFFDKHDFDDALGEFDTALRLDPRNEWALMRRAALFAFKNDYARAIEDDSTVIAVDPQSAAAWADRGDNRRMKDEHEEALRDIAEAIRIDPDNAQGYLLRGSIFATMKNHEHAVEAFDNALAVAPDDAQILRARASSLSEIGQFDRAADDEDAAFRLDDGNASAWNNRCWHRALAGRLQAALEACNESLRLKPDDSNALDSRAFTFLKMGNTEEAIEGFTAALALEPKQVASLHGRGLAKLRRGDIAGGCADITGALAVDPSVAPQYARYGLPIDPARCHATQPSPPG